MDSQSSIKVVLFDNTHYPSPPKRITLDFKPQDLVNSIKQKVIEHTKYPEDKFDITYNNNKPFEPEEGKTFEQVGATKLLLAVNRKSTASASDFPDLQEEKKPSPVEELKKSSKAEEEKPKEKSVEISKKPVETKTDPQQNECGICLTEAEDLESLGCKHLFCKECIAKHLKTEFDEKRKSFLDISCPGIKCSQKISSDLFKKFATDETLKNYESVFKTIPKNPQDPNLKLEDFYYTYNDKGMLVHKETGDKFHWVNQIHYDLLGDLIIPYVQERMKKEFNLSEVFIPDSTTHISNNIFMTQDALTNSKKLMLLIQGSGAVRAGQWARALCINDSLDQGTIIPYLRKAIAAGFAVIVFNPNLNRVPKDPAAARPRYEDFFIPGKPQPREVPTVKIPNSESPPEHTVYVWDTFGAKSPAKEIVIVAHSAGGACTMALLREREKQVLAKLKAIAFTDSVHSSSSRDPPAVRKFLKDHAINWVQSDKPLDTPMPKSEGTKCVSAGHPKHEYTSPSAIESVFKFLNSKVSN